MTDVEGLGDLNRLAADMTAAPGRTAKQVGAALGRGADRMRDAIQAEGQSRGYSGDVRARRERSGDPAGYVFAEGPGYFFAEVGSPTWGPNPIASKHFDRLVGSVVSDIQNVEVL